ncbi:cyclopropane-fatty-acyl-phospholipid synthase [Candidatus Parcubacteria bacterium]|nr:MAG: cyclopropane-fatty-acyl-phospholipid synthase [Candidatus Parcubacteria bacterium]
MNIFKTIIFKYFRDAKLKGSIKFLHKNKQEVVFGDDFTQSVVVNVLDDRFYRRIVLNGDIGLGEAYFLKYFETDDLVSLFEWFILNKEELPGFNSKEKKFKLFEWSNAVLRIYHKLNKNTKKGSKKNIKYHYDVSNDFYKLWLDKTMTYSSAVFEGSMNLEEAQKNKYRKICEKLDLQTKDHVLEIGSGWGGFSMYAASHYGCKITTVTISEEQYSYAKEKIESAGLSDKIEILLKDYRDLDGKYDKLVSIEMMEALGHEYLGKFIGKCNEVLKSGAHAVLQFITYPDQDFDEYLKNNNYIKKYIFPGGELISFGRFKKLIEKSESFYIKSKESIGNDYAKTLEIWANNFCKKRKEIFSLGFDEKFFLMWLYYFKYCEAGFATGYLDDLQVKILKK